MAKAHIYFFLGGGTPYRNSANWEVGTPHIPLKLGDGGGDTAHTFLMGGTIGVGKPHNIEKMGGGHRTYFFDGGNNWGGDTAQH